MIYEMRLNENLEEDVERPVEGFPHMFCCEEMERRPGGFAPWHWHEDVEFLWVMQGGVRLDTGSHSFTLRTGEGAFINSNMLHYKECLPGAAPIVLNQLFDVQLLAGGYHNVFEKKYITPIIECRELEAFIFRPSVANQRQIIELFRHSYDAAERREYGYEFTVRNDLSSMWCLLCQEAAHVMQAKKTVSSQGEERIKKMMLYIRDHYSEKISLEEIAVSANISGRECLRCFRDMLNISPFGYLMDYRIRRAAGLLRETDRTVTDIAFTCGFFGTSYFGKVFKKSMNCTPGQYRKLYREEQKAPQGGDGNHICSGIR
ncbi:AraC family transcriptional regulator [bacterium 1XD8-76]|nr:AraC family transcriptional regulator [bacterium 1XD8-76]